MFVTLHVHTHKPCDTHTMTATMHILYPKAKRLKKDLSASPGL